jgi:hypothetical protein
LIRGETRGRRIGSDARHLNVSKCDRGQLDTEIMPEHVDLTEIG